MANNHTQYGRHIAFAHLAFGILLAVAFLNFEGVTRIASLAALLQGAFGFALAYKRSTQKGFSIPLLLPPTLVLLGADIMSFWNVAKTQKSLDSVLPLYVSSSWYEALAQIDFERAQLYIVAAVGFVLAGLSLQIHTAALRRKRLGLGFAIGACGILGFLFFKSAAPHVLAISALSMMFVGLAACTRDDDAMVVLSALAAALGALLSASHAEWLFEKSQLAQTLVSERDLGAMSMGMGLIIFESFENACALLNNVFWAAAFLVVLSASAFFTLALRSLKNIGRVLSLAALVFPLVMIQLGLSQVLSSMPLKINALEKPLLAIDSPSGGSRARASHAPLLIYKTATVDVDGYQHALSFFYSGQKEGLKNILDAAFARHAEKSVEDRLPSSSGFSQHVQKRRDKVILAPEKGLDLRVFRERLRALHDAGIVEIDLLLKRQRPSEKNPFATLSQSYGLGVPIEHPLVMSLTLSAQPANVIIDASKHSLRINSLSFENKTPVEVSNTLMKNAPKNMVLKMSAGKVDDLVKVIDPIAVFSQRPIVFSLAENQTRKDKDQE